MEHLYALDVAVCTEDDFDVPDQLSGAIANRELIWLPKHIVGPHPLDDEGVFEFHLQKDVARRDAGCGV